jgi:hypothetical protein
MWDDRIKAKEDRLSKLKKEHETLRNSPNESDNRRADELFNTIKQEASGLANLRTLYSSVTGGSSDSDAKRNLHSDEERKLVSGKKG